MIELFSRSNAIGSYLIRLKTWSDWSHCAILTPDNTVIEAVFIHGVREIPFDEWKSTKTRYSSAKRDIPNPEASLSWLRSQIGKPYDDKALIGGLFDRNWQEPSKWYCSELTESAFAAGGNATFNPATSKTVSPKDRWRVL